MKKNNVPGLSMVIFNDREIEYSQGFGVKNTTTGEPVDEDTIFEAASFSKTLTAYAALILVEKGRLSLDEPLNNLDMKHSVQIMKVLRRLVDELGKTVIIVIHDINFASCYSDYIVALKDGRVIHEGPTQQIIDSTVLEEIYDMNMSIQNIDEKQICIYYV